MHKFTKFFLFGALTFIVVMAANEASAGERNRSGTYKSRLGEGTFEKQTQREKGTVNKNTTWQNRNGQQGSSQYNGNWDRQSKSGTSERTTSWGNGKTATTNNTYQRNPDGTFGVNSTTTGPKGGTATSNRTYTRNEDGTYTMQKNATGPNGQVWTNEHTVTKNEEGGWTKQGIYTTPDGQGGTYTQQGGRTGEGTGNVQTTVTGANGNSYNRTADYTHEGNTWTRSVTQTGPKGNSHSWSGNVQFND